MQVIGYLGRLDQMFGVPGTTRNWNTITGNRQSAGPWSDLMVSHDVSVDGDRFLRVSARQLTCPLIVSCLSGTLLGVAARMAMRFVALEAGVSARFSGGFLRSSCLVPSSGRRWHCCSSPFARELKAGRLG